MAWTLRPQPVLVFSLVLALASCTMANPEFVVGRDFASDEGTDAVDDGTTDDGTTDDGTTDGPGSTSTSTSTSDDTETGPDEECIQPSGGVFEPCENMGTCDDGFLCVGFSTMMGLVAYCTPDCASVEDCSWGSRDQCTHPGMACLPLFEQEEMACVAACDVDQECWPGWYCDPSAQACLPLP